MTVFQNGMYGPQVQRQTSRSKAEGEANALLAKFGLGEFKDKYPNQLSGGMQRRAELARALINRPRILLMDEPFRGLDAMTRQLMQEYLLRLFEGSGQTILFVTSEIDEAILLADVIVLLSRSPASTKDVIQVDLPRPRGVSLFGSSRYAELKRTALSLLYREAVEAFASGTSSAADLVEAFELRHGTEAP
jgi:NitT/TauT family transport system ATP-binding protein